MGRWKKSLHSTGALERGARPYDIKAIGCYIDDDTSEEIILYLNSDEPYSKWKGQRPFEFLRAHSYTGKQCRVLLSDIKYAETFRNVVDTKRKSHTRGMQLLEMDPEDADGSIYVFGMRIDWYNLEQLLKGEDYRTLLYKLYGPDVFETSTEKFEVFLNSDLRLFLIFYYSWENARRLEVLRRADMLMKKHFNDSAYIETIPSAEKLLEELRDIKADQQTG